MSDDLKRVSMSRVDTAWLRMEKPSNRMMITGVMVFKNELQYQKLLELIETRFLAFPRFSFRPVERRNGAYWEEDPDFDLHTHVKRVALPGLADDDELRDYVSDLASSALDPSRPMWQFHYIENYGEGGALVSRIHHCYADGLALVQVMLSLTDGATQFKPSRKVSSSGHNADLRKQVEKILATAQSGVELAKLWSSKGIAGLVQLIEDPQKLNEYAGEAGDILSEVIHAVTLSDDPKTSLKGRLGPRKNVAWCPPISLQEVKSIGKSLGCTVNDVLISCASGALREYLLQKNPDQELPGIRATVPVNLRPLHHAKELGNHFGLVFLDLPINLENPLRRLQSVHEHMQALKKSRQAVVTLGALSILGMAPASVQEPALDLFSQKASCVLTNVPGPQQALALGGSEIDEIMFWVPQSGGIGIGISILSYNGKVQFGLISDRRLIEKPEEVIANFGKEFEKLIHAVMLVHQEVVDIDEMANHLDVLLGQ